MMFFLRLVWNIFMRLFLKFYVKLSFRGLALLPKDRGFIIVANHCSHLDTLGLLAAVPLKKINQTHVAAAKDCFFTTSWRSILFKFVVNAFPFERVQNSYQSLLTCSKTIVEKQKILVFFPEGTRSLTGAMQKFKPGIGVLAAGIETVIVPAFIEGAHQAWPKGRWFPMPHPVQITFGKPMSFSNVPRTKEGFCLIAHELEQKITQMKVQNDLYSCKMVFTHDRSDKCRHPPMLG